MPCVNLLSDLRSGQREDAGDGDGLAGDVLLVEDGGEDFAYYTYSDALDIAETINAACGL